MANRWLKVGPLNGYRGLVSDGYDALHEAVRLDPESVWDTLRAFLCSRAAHDERLDLIEDLMFWHPDAFIDRIEALADDCPRSWGALAEAEVGGRTETPGLTRFYALQHRLGRQPARSSTLGDITRRWRRRHQA